MKIYINSNYEIKSINQYEDDSIASLIATTLEEK